MYHSGSLEFFGLRFCFKNPNFSSLFSRGFNLYGYSSVIDCISEIFIPDENGNPLSEVLVEKYENYDIYWYHWPYDGPKWFSLVIHEEDYEPVIVIYCNDEISCIITRPHWEYHYSDVNETGLKIPPQVLFEDEWHPALAKTSENIREFELKKLDLIQFPYPPRTITSEQIPARHKDTAALLEGPSAANKVQRLDQT